MNHLQLTLGQLASRALELRQMASRQQGQALIEYALIVSLVALAAIAALTMTGTHVSTLLNKVAGDV
jgi:Flp pilus assembly pilin Flp